MLTELSTADFSFYVKYASEMRKCHDSEFMKEINPNYIRAFYRGKKFKDERFTQLGIGQTQDEHLLNLCMVFSGANTILPNLYYRNPSAIVTALKGRAEVSGVVPEESAALMSALLKYYSKRNKAKEENQDAALNGYFFGLGWKKISYQMASQPAPQIAEEPETRKEEGASNFSFMGLINPQEEPKQTDPLQHGERYEFQDEEGLISTSESPLNVAVDHKSDLRNGKAHLHFVNRSLYEIMNFPGYDQSVMAKVYEKYKHSRGTRLDTRDVDLLLMELHVKQRNGTWVLVWIDGFDQPLYYERSILGQHGFQLFPLVFTNEPGVRYPISHMKIACQVQDKIDKMAALFYETVARQRNMLFVHKGDLEPGTLDAIERNKIGGIAITNKPINAGTFGHAQSPSVQNDLPSLIRLCQQNLIQVMGADEQLVTGSSKNDTLGQDELARMGTKVRESGMQDRMKDFLIEGAEKEAVLLKEFCSAQIELEVAGEDFADPIMAEQYEKESIKFMSEENPLPVSRFIDKIDYNFDFNMEDAIKPDREKIMSTIERVIAFGTNPIVENALNEDGSQLAVGALAKEWVGNAEALGNPRKYIRPMTSLQLAYKQAKKMMLGGVMTGGSAPPIPKPAEGAKMAGKPEREPTSSEAAKL